MKVFLPIMPLCEEDNAWVTGELERDEVLPTLEDHLDLIEVQA